MKVIPVLDILDGAVVHGVRGLRSEYRPIRSVLTDSTKPLDVAVVFKEHGFCDLYVADLDAITGKGYDFSLFKKIVSKTGLQLMVDAGFDDSKRIDEAFKNGVSKVVIGTETLSRLDFVEEAVKLFGPQKIVLSLDFKEKTVLSKFEVSENKKPMILLQEFINMGVSQVIVLDLTRVGSENGVNFGFLEEALAKRTIRVFTGGGVRDINDLIDLRNKGVFGALVATALHSGKISPEELGRIDML